MLYGGLVNIKSTLSFFNSDMFADDLLYRENMDMNKVSDSRSVSKFVIRFVISSIKFVSNREMGVALARLIRFSSKWCYFFRGAMINPYEI